LFRDTPTAVQAVDDTHDTPLKELVLTSAGFGVDCTDHSVPFQRSANVTSVPALLT
jgi:hypothetical protein